MWGNREGGEAAMLGSFFHAPPPADEKDRKVAWIIAWIALVMGILMTLLPALLPA